ncbi:MAG: HTH domain-containing protein [Clostridiales bacterium]|nr:HTH domain-containing protein [Clostridiales bacterium]
MVDKAELSLMLDYYGAFLTERQSELMHMSADEDMSLSEISEQVGVSRQAVRDHLAKASKELCGMEETLGMAERDRRLRAICDMLDEAVASGNAELAVNTCASAAEMIRATLR